MDVRPAAFNETVIVINGFSTTFPLVATFYCFFSPFYLYPLGGEKWKISALFFCVCTKLSKLMEFLVCWVHGRGQSDLSASFPLLSRCPNSSEGDSSQSDEFHRSRQLTVPCYSLLLLLTVTAVRPSPSGRGLYGRLRCPKHRRVAE